MTPAEQKTLLGMSEKEFFFWIGKKKFDLETRRKIIDWRAKNSSNLIADIEEVFGEKPYTQHPLDKGL